MKKLLFFVMCLAFIYSQAQSPITLWSYNTNLTPGVVNAVSGSITGINAPAEGANLSWDYSSVTTSPTNPFSYSVPNSSFFPEATYADTNLSSVFIAGRYFYYSMYYKKDTSGVYGLGDIIHRQPYGIGALTGNNNDSCIFPEKQDIFTNPMNVIRFSATMSSSWVSNYTMNADFELTIASLSLNHTPCTRISYLYRFDSIVGWGKLRIPAGSGHSIPYDVLLEKRMGVTVDSFYMNGTIAPSSLLSNFGLAQGTRTVMNRHVFWREFCRYPVIIFNYGSNNFTTPSSMYFDMDVQADPHWGLDNVSQSGGVSLYPNPNNGQFDLEFANVADKHYSIAVFNIFGQEIVKEFIDVSGNFKMPVQINGAGAGIYQLVISSGDEKQVFKIIVR